MALDVSPANLIRERTAARTVRDAQLRQFRHSVNLYTGPYSHESYVDYWPDNFIAQFITLMLPKTAFNNPKVRVNSSSVTPQKVIDYIREQMFFAAQAAQEGLMDPAQAQQLIQEIQGIIEDLEYYKRIADSLEYGINQWIRMVDGKETLLHAIANQMFAYGVIQTTQEEMNGSFLPKWTNVSPSRFGFDPLTLMFGNARYCFQEIIRDKDDLLEEAKSNRDMGWNEKLIRGLPEDSNVNEIRAGTKNASDAPPRGEITYTEFWTPEELPDSPGPDKGFNGTLYTIASSTEDYLRKPVPYYGPATGPYTLFGVYPVPDSPFPLSPILMHYAQGDDHNQQVRAALDSARNYKRIVFVPAGNPDVAAAVKNSPHDFVVPIKGLKKDEIIDVEIGGVPDQLIKQMAMTRETLRRSSGMTENTVGEREEGTATEAAIIDESAQARMGFVQQRANHGTQQACRNVLHYLYYDGRSEIDLDEEAADELDMIQPAFIGGVERGRKPEFHKLSLEVDVHSMPMSNPNLEERRAVDAFEQIVSSAPVIGQTPWIDWQKAFDITGEARNQDDFSDIIRQDVLDQAYSIQEEQQRAAASGSAEGQENGAGRLRGRQTGATAAADRRR